MNIRRMLIFIEFGKLLGSNNISIDHGELVHIDILKNVPRPKTWVNDIKYDNGWAKFKSIINHIQKSGCDYLFDNPSGYHLVKETPQQFRDRISSVCPTEIEYITLENVPFSKEFLYMLKRGYNGERAEDTYLVNMQYMHQYFSKLGPYIDMPRWKKDIEVMKKMASLHKNIHLKYCGTNMHSSFKWLFGIESQQEKAS